MDVVYRIYRFCPIFLRLQARRLLNPKFQLKSDIRKKAEAAKFRAAR